MKLSWNVILDQLRNYNLEVHVTGDLTRQFLRPALLPQSFDVMREDLLHICLLSDAMRASAERPGMGYICARNRIKDDKETEASLSGMIIINENMEVELLLNLVEDIYQRISDWYQSMQDMLIRERGLQELLELSEPIIGNTINISDSAFTLLARTTHIETDDPISQDLREFGYHPESTLQLFRQHHRYEIWNQSHPLIINDSRTISPYVMVNRVFRFRNTYFTHVVMVCDHHGLSDGLLELFAYLTDILAIYAERNWKDKNAMSHNYDSFLTDLLQSVITRQEDIEERAKYLGISAKDRMRVMKLTVGTGAEVALGRIARELGELMPSSQILLYEQAVMVLLHLRPNGIDTGIPEEQLSLFLSRHGAKAAFSNVFFNLGQLRSGWIQASLALKYSGALRGAALTELLMVMPDQPVIPHFQDRVLHGLLGENPVNESLWRESIYYQALYDLWTFDAQHGSNNLQLLRVYLWNERKATETGQTLHMHRNNVIYRIGRIEDMTGLNLSDHGTRLGLEMSFLLLEIFGFPEAENAK